MSCRHGNHYDGCDICDEVDASFEAGRRSALAEQPAPAAQEEPVAQHRDLHSHMMVVAHRAADAVSSHGQKPTSQKAFVRAICTAIQADKNLLAKLTPQAQPAQRKSLTLQELEAAWNAQADHMNQWNALCLDEMVAWAQAAHGIKENT